MRWWSCPSSVCAMLAPALGSMLACGSAVATPGDDMEASSGAAGSTTMNPGVSTGGDADAVSSGVMTGPPDPPEPTGSTGSASSTSATEMSDSSGDEGSGSTSNDPVELDCPALCIELARGSCFEIDGFGSCEAACEETLAGSDFQPALDAFAECAATNPLCFETPEQCIWGALYPKPAEYPVSYTLTGSALEDAEMVFVRVESGGEPSPIVAVPIVNGVATAELNVVQTLGQSLWIRMFVDRDGDGACGDDEVGQTDWLMAVPPFEAPRFEGSSVLASDGPTEVCGAF